jgi:hypothetical protein
MCLRVNIVFNQFNQYPTVKKTSVLLFIYLVYASFSEKFDGIQNKKIMRALTSVEYRERERERERERK